MLKLNFASYSVPSFPLISSKSKKLKEAQIEDILPVHLLIFSILIPLLLCFLVRKTKIYVN